MKHRTVRKCEENTSEDYKPVLVNYQKIQMKNDTAQVVYVYISIRAHIKLASRATAWQGIFEGHLSPA